MILLHLYQEEKNGKVGPEDLRGGACVSECGPVTK